MEAMLYVTALCRHEELHMLAGVAGSSVSLTSAALSLAGEEAPWPCWTLGTGQSTLVPSFPRTPEHGSKKKATPQPGHRRGRGGGMGLAGCLCLVLGLHGWSPQPPQGSPLCTPLYLHEVPSFQRPPSDFTHSPGGEKTLLWKWEGLFSAVERRLTPRQGGGCPPPTHCGLVAPWD